MKSKGIYDDALIITGDHGESYSNVDNETKIFHVPLLIIDHHNTGINSKPVSHADVAEFILSKTNYKGYSHLAGTNLVNSKPAQTFYMGYNNELYKVTDSCLYRFNLAKRVLAKINPDSLMYVSSMEEIGKSQAIYSNITKHMLAYYTCIRFEFENGLYKCK